MTFDKAKFLTRFVDEAKEHVKSLNDGLIDLEKTPGDIEILNGIFRSAHTIKGSSRMMKLMAVSETAHRLEDALDALRQGDIRLTGNLSDLLFKTLDVISEMLERIKAGEDIAEAPADLCEELENASKGESSQDAETSIAPPEQNQEIITPEQNQETIQPEDASEKISEATEEEAIKKRKEKIARTIIDAKKAKKEKVTRKKNSPQKIIEKKSRASVNDTIRIDSEKLDELIKLMGEMVSGHNRTKQRIIDINRFEKQAEQNLEWLTTAASKKDFLSKEDISSIVANANLMQSILRQLTAGIREDANLHGHLIGDLQDTSLRMRMLPLSTIFDGFHRTVRDLSKSFGKKIDFIVEGSETELDKKIIERIGDPLIHMIRNSIDHGIEMPDIRAISGKSETGYIRLHAGYEGGNVHIRLSDDGAGIHVDKIREKALKKKIYDESDIENLPETEVIDLIFHPGFSTSEIITDFSGRGVGMDVVKKNIIEDLKGTINIETEEGKGTAFNIRLPLTMAIIHVLLISVAGKYFTVPSNYIDEVLRTPAEDVINVVDKKAIRLREQIIPIAYLGDILNLNQDSIQEKSDFLVLIATIGNENMGIIIDELISEEDMVIKPLPSHMKNIPWVSGCIISGRNEIINVLHMPNIITAAKEIKIKKRIDTTASIEPERIIRILVADDSISTREIEKSILESYGYQVALAGDGKEAFEKAQETLYDLVVSDVEMPRMDGFTLTRKLRNEVAYQNVPIILVTSRDKEEDKRRGIEVGADAYIIKGAFDQTNLIDSVRNLVG